MQSAAPEGRSSCAVFSERIAPSWSARSGNGAPARRMPRSGEAADDPVPWLARDALVSERVVRQPRAEARQPSRTSERRRSAAMPTAGRRRAARDRRSWRRRSDDDGDVPRPGSLLRTAWPSSRPSPHLRGHQAQLGAPLPAACTACAPSTASITVWPSPSRAKRSSWRFTSLSSTTRIVMGTGEVSDSPLAVPRGAAAPLSDGFEANTPHLRDCIPTRDSGMRRSASVPTMPRA